MPPARPRPVVDDSRSETSSVIAGMNERGNNGKTISKTKKTGTGVVPDSYSTLKAAVNGAVAAANVTSNNANEVDAGVPQTDWNSLPTSTLHTYRAAYQLQIPSAYTHAHADLIYASSQTALRAPSVVRARRQQRELQHLRRTREHLNRNGVIKSKKPTSKDKRKDDASDGSRQKQADLPTPMDTSIAQSIEPPSPTAQSQSQSASSDNNNNTPSLLNTTNPDSTLIGRSSPKLLATTVRKHFNAQQLNEAETIAKFTYVVKQQGYGNAAAALAASSSSNNNNNNSSGGGGGSGGNNNNNNNVSSISNLKLSIPIQVEGSGGDGKGWIMGSMGRQVRMSDSGGGGAFRLRFRP